VRKAHLARLKVAGGGRVAEITRRDFLNLKDGKVHSGYGEARREFLERREQILRLA